MEEKYQQINIGTQTNYNSCTINNYYPQPVAETTKTEPDQTEGTTTASDLFGRITKAAHDKDIAQQIEDELRSASVSAPKLVKCIKTNEALGYLDTKNMSSVDLYKLLDEHFHLPFKLRTFQENRSK